MSVGAKDVRTRLYERMGRKVRVSKKDCLWCICCKAVRIRIGLGCRHDAIVCLARLKEGGSDTVPWYKLGSTFMASELEINA